MKSVYLETSIVSYLAARPSRDIVVAAHQQITHDWFRVRGIMPPVICTPEELLGNQP